MLYCARRGTRRDSSLASGALSPAYQRSALANATLRSEATLLRFVAETEVRRPKPLSNLLAGFTVPLVSLRDIFGRATEFQAVAELARAVLY